MDQPALQPTCFDRDTTLRPLGEGRFGVTISRDWWVVAGPNGGLVAALLVKAAEAAVSAKAAEAAVSAKAAEAAVSANAAEAAVSAKAAEAAVSAKAAEAAVSVKAAEAAVSVKAAEAAVSVKAAEAAVSARRSTRSVTVHYLMPPAEGPAELVTSVERVGRAMSFVSVRLVQDDKVRSLGLVALGTSRPPGRGAELAFQHAPVPTLPPPEHCPRLVAVDPPGDEPSLSHIRHRWDSRWAIGWLPAGEAPPPPGVIEHGGWVRLAEPQPYEPAVLAAMADAWIPPLLTRPELGRFSVPTVELTVHILDRAALDDLAPDDWCRVRFATDTAADGFVTEEGSIWSPDGSLLAHARQLALLTPFPEGRMPPVLALEGAGGPPPTDEHRAAL